MQNKNYDLVLREASEYFLNQGINIIGKDYEVIANDEGLFEDYVEQLLEGVDNPTQRNDLRQLMINNNIGILNESYAGIQPISSFSGPTIRKLWPKFAVKEAIPTEVALSPRISKIYQKPVIYRTDDEGNVTEFELPFDIDEAYGKGDYNDFTGKKNLVKTALYVNGSGSETVQFSTDIDGPSRVKKQPLDTNIRVANVEIGNMTGTPEEFKAEANEFVKMIPQHRLDIMNGFELEIPYGEANDQVLTIIARADLLNAKVKLAVFGAPTGKAVQVTLSATASTEFNEEHDSVSIKTGRFDIDLPTGQHLVAEVPTELMTDLKALYNIDGTTELISTMTDIFSLRLDKEALAFLKQTAGGLGHPGAAGYATNANKHTYVLNFDLRPAAGFTGGQKAWREQLKPMVDHLAQRIKNATYLKSGHFVILGNPIDVAVLDNINWTQRDGERSVNGVEVDYKVGYYTGVNDYKIVQSQTVTPGQMFILFVPTGASNQMTVKYFPYQYTTIIDKYASANRSRVPAIMMTKRHTFHEFLPAVGTINLINNDGNPHGAFGNYWAGDTTTPGGVWGDKSKIK